MSIIGLLQAAAVLTALFSSVTALNFPQHNIGLFAHFRLQYFVVSVLLSLVFVSLHRYAFAGTMLLTALLNGFFIITWYLPRSSKGAGSERLKLLHANVLSNNDKYQRLIDLIDAEDPDIVFLQEVTDDWVSGLTTLQENYPFSYTVAQPGNFGIAVYAKTRFDSVGHVDSPPLGHPTIIATTTVGKQKLTLISSHPTIPLGREQSSDRNQQLNSLVDQAAAADGKVVLLGDFNATMWDPHFKRLLKSAGLSNTRQGFGILPTWPTYLPFAMIPIDHCLIPDSIGVTDLRTGKSIGSDHLPLIVTLCL